MLFGLLTDQTVLHLLLISHLLDERSHLVHGASHLLSNALLAVQRRVLRALDPAAQHFALRLEPLTQVVQAARPIAGFIFDLSLELFVHLSQHLDR